MNTQNYPQTSVVSRSEKPHTLRDARELPLAARVDAIWLCDGGSADAARLLRVTEASLMASFVDGYQAATAWCERPENWAPEHSLGGDFGAQTDEGLMFEIRTSTSASGTYLEGWLLPRAANKELLVVTYGLGRDCVHWAVVHANGIPPACTNAAAACCAAVHRRSLEMTSRMSEGCVRPELEITVG